MVALENLSIFLIHQNYFLMKKIFSSKILKKALKIFPPKFSMSFYLVYIENHN